MIDFELKVYLSCSWKKDLDTEKEAVEKLFKDDLLMHPVYGQGSESDVTMDYFSRLNLCDITVVLLGSKYSKHVENEFRYSLNNKIPTLVFAKECERDKELQEKIKSLYLLLSITYFKEVSELKEKVKEKVIELLSKHFQYHRNIEKAIYPLIGCEIRYYYPKPSESEYKDVPRINPFERR